MRKIKKAKRKHDGLVLLYKLEGNKLGVASPIASLFCIDLLSHTQSSTCNLQPINSQ